MQIVVKKFGGTSVGDVTRIKNVARLIKDYLENHPQEKVAVVVSAMSGETNRLIALAKSCVEIPDPRELDQLVATGEQVTIALLSMALMELGIPAKSLQGQQARISTDRRHTNAQITDIDGTKVKGLIASGYIPVIAGFQGIDDEGDVTTLGRGGSDITAVAVAAAVQAKACYIYTDVEGVYSTDPRICRNVRMLERVCHEEMLEMASLGAKVLHPRSVYFAMCYHVPLVVLSTFNPGNGTWIVREEELMEKPVVTGITYRTDEAKLVVKGIQGGSTAITTLFSRLAEEGLFIDMITQTGSGDEPATLSFTVPDESSSRALALTQEALSSFTVDEVRLDRDTAKVSVVGIGMRYHSGVAAKMFAALAAENIDIQMISTSEIKISVIIPRKYCEVAVRTLHEAFIELKPRVALEA